MTRLVMFAALLIALAIDRCAASEEEQQTIAKLSNDVSVDVSKAIGDPTVKKIRLKPRRRPPPIIERDAAENNRATGSSQLAEEPLNGMGEIVYEDEQMQGELSDWIPPPPPPPPQGMIQRIVSRPTTTTASYNRVFSRGTSARLFGDDFALFLVILTIAGFFGLMLAMFMPFTFLLQQPYAFGSPLAGYPAALTGYPGVYPPYGRRRRRHVFSGVWPPVKSKEEQLVEQWELALATLLSALEAALEYDQQET